MVARKPPEAVLSVRVWEVVPRLRRRAVLRSVRLRPVVLKLPEVVLSVLPWVVVLRLRRRVVLQSVQLRVVLSVRLQAVVLRLRQRVVLRNGLLHPLTGLPRRVLLRKRNGPPSVQRNGRLRVLQPRLRSARKRLPAGRSDRQRSKERTRKRRTTRRSVEDGVTMTE